MQKRLRSIVHGQRSAVHRPGLFLFLQLAAFPQFCAQTISHMKSFFRYTLRSAMLAAVLLLSHLAFCWGLTGHRIIGEIAQQHLRSKARKEIKKLFGSESLAWWSNWPDFIKSDSTWNHASKWHYIDLPGHISKEEFITGLKKLPGQNLYTQIQDMVAQLKNKSLPLKQRQEALRFLVHLVGDLHQPLHVGRDEDQGGNKIVVYWFDKKTNLHTFWDSMFIDFQQYSYTEYAKLLNIASKEDVKKWQSGTLEDWFYESHEISDKIYDATPNESKLSYKYNYQFQQTLEEQLLKGGLRLAAVLNAAFE